jgi:hypothetical protein
MKKVVTLFAICAVFASCTATKSIHVRTDLFTETVDSFRSEKSRFIDTSYTEKGSMTITEIEFFPVPIDSVPATGTSAHIPSGSISFKDFNFSGGAVKSIRQTVLEKEVEQKGLDIENELVEENVHELVEVSSTQDIEAVTNSFQLLPARYMPYFIILIAGGCIFTFHLLLKRLFSH